MVSTQLYGICTCGGVTHRIVSLLRAASALVVAVVAAASLLGPGRAIETAALRFKATALAGPDAAAARTLRHAITVRDAAHC